jgi:hypothetical protein
VDGALVPKGPELWLIFSSFFLLIAWIYSVLMLTDTLKSHFAKEFLFELKWPIGYLGTTCYLFSLIHATPKTTVIKNGRTFSEKSVLPSKFVLNISFFFLSALGIFPLVFGAITGYYADQGEDATAAFYVSAHYLSWSIVVMIYTVVLIFFGYQLMSLLRKNMKQLLSSNKASMSGSAGGNGASSDHTSSNGGGYSQNNIIKGGRPTTTNPNGGNNNNNNTKINMNNINYNTSARLAISRMRKAIISMLITMCAIGSITAVFAVLLGFYAFRRVAMHSNPKLNIFIAILWLYNTPVLILATYGAIWWTTRAQRVLMAREKATNNAVSSMVQEAAGVGTYSSNGGNGSSLSAKYLSGSGGDGMMMTTSSSLSPGAYSGPVYNTNNGVGTSSFTDSATTLNVNNYSFPPSTSPQLPQYQQSPSAFQQQQQQQQQFELPSYAQFHYNNNQMNNNFGYTSPGGMAMGNMNMGGSPGSSNGVVPPVRRLYEVELGVKV